MTQTRKTDTKHYIKEALSLLLKETDFERLTISQITKKAGINRGTFYLHYTDKYDMMLQLKADTLSHIETLLEENRDNPKRTILQVLEYLKEEFDFLSAISKSSFVNLTESIKDFVFQILSQEEDLEKQLVATYQIPYPYAIEVYLSSIESLISLWIERGAIESPEEMMEIIFQVVYVKLQ